MMHRTHRSYMIPDTSRRLSWCSYPMGRTSVEDSHGGGLVSGLSLLLCKTPYRT
jgi:hypothetical protein